MMKYANILLVLVLLGGCGGTPSDVDSGTTADTGSTADTGTTADAGPVHDGGPVEDTGAVGDAGPGDAGPVCAPAGTYDVVWTGAGTNSPDCPMPATPAEVGADGFDSMFSECPAGCDATCSRALLDPATCMASGTISAPCLGLGKGRTITASYSYSGDTASFTVNDNMTPAGPCSYTGVGTRR